MGRLTYLIFIFLLFITANIAGAQTIQGVITDAVTKQPLPFATIKLDDAGNGTVADINGKFKIQENAGTRSIEVSYIGYVPQQVQLPASGVLYIALQPNEKELNEVIIKPPYDKIKRIINSAIANRANNNPDKYDWYQCHVYYKMLGDISIPDSLMDDDTSKNGRLAKALVDSQHLVMSETYSLRTWSKPEKLQEDILATRLSGFKNTMFTSLVTNVLPFHAYNNYLTLNGKDYHNPISRGFTTYYDFNLDNELLQGKDTVWILSFRPRKNLNELKGSVYINSSGYAVAYLLASAKDTDLNRDIRIEQQYKKIIDSSTGIAKWFPDQLNYIIAWTQKSDSFSMDFFIKGTSVISDVSFEENKHFHFDKLHTVRLQPMAENTSDSMWHRYRLVPLDIREKRTYTFDDSLMKKIHADKILPYLSKLPEGKVPIGILDFDLKRLFSFNQYENVRLGLGIQTNEKLIKWLSVGGWAGYGFRDKQWKYGAFAEIYADKYKEFVFNVGYSDDINDPGRIHLNNELDRNYLRRYLLNRVDEIKTYSAAVKKRLGYWSIEVNAQQQDILPKYDYIFLYKGEGHTNFTAKEAGINLRFAYAERTAPFFGYYHSLGSKYPIWYAHLSSGTLESGNLQIPYTQAVSAVVWHKHINRIGYEHFLLEGGYTWSNDPLPLSKLFAGNGYRYDKSSLYAFGGMMTIYPYQYYSDNFVNFIWRHDFDWKLYKLQIPKSKISSAPFISIGYDLLYGTMRHPEVHKGVNISIPDNGYNEAGAILNGLLLLKYANLYYLSLNVGYYYHLTNMFDLNNEGKFVIGASIIL